MKPKPGQLDMFSETCARYTYDTRDAGRYSAKEAKEHEYLCGEPDGHVVIFPLPPSDYANDLNAMHEAEKTLEGKSKAFYYAEEVMATILRHAGLSLNGGKDPLLDFMLDEENDFNWDDAHAPCESGYCE